MSMKRELYPKNWDEIAAAKKESTGWKCEKCGMQCRKPGEKFDTHKRTLTVHHIDKDPGNCDPENLVALCAGCHLAAHVYERKKRKLDKLFRADERAEGR